MKILQINNKKQVKKSKKEILKELKACKNETSKILVSDFKLVESKEPIYIVEMSAKEFQLVSFYLELENRKPILNVEIDTESKRRAKMSKELEASKSLKIIKEMYEHFVKTYRELEPKLMICEKEDFDIIETALKEYEFMKQTKIIVDDKKISDDDLEKLKNQGIIVGNLEQSKIEPLFDNETQNKLKALEIIKNKQVNVFVLLHIEDLETYNDMIGDNRNLTQQEYDLLREVLL